MKKIPEEEQNENTDYEISYVHEKTSKYGQFRIDKK